MARRSSFGIIRDYFEMCKESDGFNVNHTGKLLCGGILERDKSAKEDVEDALHLAKYALDHHNNTHNSDLWFVSLDKFNGQIVGGVMYYMHDLRKIPQLSRLKRRKQVARLASRAWRSIPTETKLRHYNSRNLNYHQEVARFVR